MVTSFDMLGIFNLDYHINRKYLAFNTGYIKFVKAADSDFLGFIFIGNVQVVLVELLLRIVEI